METTAHKLTKCVCRKKQKQEQREIDIDINSTRTNSPGMASSSSILSPPIILPFVFFLISLSIEPVLSTLSSTDSTGTSTNSTTLNAREEFFKYKRIRAKLNKINKLSLKTIQSEDGDVIDCVPSHLQPAFDHPLLKGQKPLDPPELPKGCNLSSSLDDILVQKWRTNGESCPDGTVPIRRTTEKDLLRASSVQRFGMKPPRRVRRDSTSSSHEHAVGYINGDQYYGAQASINVWSPQVNDPSEFSLSQMWVISGSFGNDLNTIEAGWQVSPELYGDNSPRFFTYWTTDAYQETGCYNHYCSGFVQTNNKIAIGAAISPTSFYSGRQFDISILIWKDPQHGHWWLKLGSGAVVGYWPSFLFTHLAQHANMVQFGGEIVNTRQSGFHTATQMGSGHFAGEQYGKSAYFRNLQIVDWDNGLIPASNLKLLADHPNCYDIRGGVNRAWGNYFYYGGPGRNVRCP